MELFDGRYLFVLNSPDKFDPDLPLSKSKACGGTMIMWKTNFDPFITVLPTCTPALLPILFHPPGVVSTIHICLYLPTAGHDHQFIEELSNLSSTVDGLIQSCPTSSLYIHGDINVGDRNKKRKTLYSSLLHSLCLTETNINHPTYHNFIGHGQSD